MKVNLEIIHFLDTTIFTEHFINSFDKISEKTIFFIISEGMPERGYMKKSNVFLFDLNDIEAQAKIFSEINNSDTKLAIFHMLNGRKMHVINNLDKKIKKVWCLWGNDLYDVNYFYPFKNYDKQTLLFLDSGKNFLKKMYNIPEVKTSIFKILLGIKSCGFRGTLLNKMYDKFGVDRFLFIKKNIDIISYIVPKEKEILLKHFSDKTFCHLYCDPELPQFNHFSEIQNSSNNILLAHSGAKTNNHLDCLDMLRNVDIKNRKIITPLSYDGDAVYVQEVIRRGKKYFGENFVPLTERLPLDEYSKILSSCSIAIMNQRRQQAGGNLFHLIGSGTKVYLNNENGFYQYFLSGGIKVYDLKNFSQTFDEKVDLTQNRKKIQDLYSAEYFQKQINILLKSI
jgi:hypothetical protein